MVRNAIIVAVAIFLVVGIGIFFGVRALRDWNAKQAERESASTSTEARAEGRGIFGILRNPYLSREPYEPKESTQFRLRWSWGGSNSSESSGEGDSGLVMRRGDASGPEGSEGAGSSSGGSSSSRPPVKQSQIPHGFIGADISPFFDEVIITSVQPSRKSDYERTAVSVMAKSGISDPINVTGWTIKTNSGEVSIPQAIERYVPGSSLAGDITLRGGQVLFLFGHYRFAGYQHPFGKNFRLNQCTGYLNSLYEFNPKLPERCPKVEKEGLSSLSGACQTFLSQLGNCRVPTSAEISSFQGDAACQEFMRNTFGYGLCYATHKNNEEFLLNEWYAWTSPQGQIPLAKDHDRVLLLDRSGLLVDELSY